VNPDSLMRMIVYLFKHHARDTLPQHASEILIYAAHHGYRGTMQEAAPFVVFETTMSNIVPKLPSELVIPWVNNLLFGDKT
jgi:hypothetical protein